MPKLGRGGRAVLKDFGKPEGYSENIQILNGPYGIYAKYGKLNISLPKDTDLEKLSIEELLKLINEKLQDGGNSKKSPIFPPEHDCNKNNKIKKTKLEILFAILNSWFFLNFLL